MKYTFLAIIFAIIFYFASTFSNVFYNIFTTSMNNLNLYSNKTAIIWFFGLIFINICILIFIISFYYYKKNNAIGNVGPKGFDGEKGIDGTDIEGCEYQL